MPASLPQPQPTPQVEPLDLDDKEPTPRRRRRADEPRGSLVWLWVLLGAGFLGLAGGAGGFLLLRDKPAPAPAIVEKPPATPVPPPPQPVGANTPPKTDPPKAEPPKVDPPKVDPPKPPVAATVAQSIPGLKFYLPLNATANGKVTEVVSGKQVGTGFDLAVTDGPRGRKALRLSHDRKDSNRNRYALDLTDQREAFTIPAGKPFTLTFWARRFHSDSNSGFGADLLNATTDLNSSHTRRLHLQLLPNNPASAAVDLLDGLRGDSGTLKAIHPHNTVPAPEDWNHFTLIRDEQGNVWWLMNGTELPDLRVQQFSGELRYDTIGLLSSNDGKTIIDFADFCLYNRALTGAELGTLTGLKFPARSKPQVLVEGPKPAVGAIPSATSIKGLRFYLSCDELNAGSVKETVSNKFVGKGQKLALVDGPRGKALRVTAGGPNGVREGFNLTAHADSLVIAEGKPFTLALWVRTEDWDTRGGRFVDGQQIGKERFQFFSLYRFTKGIGFSINQGKPGGRPDPINQAARGTHEMAPVKGWIHLAVSRDNRGIVRLSVNGEPAAVSTTAYTAELRYTSFSLVWQAAGTFTAEIDEFCLFDRVLTAEEIAQLAGRAK
jgi:hypothetical protein